MDSEQKSHQDFSRSPAGSQLPGVPALNVGLKATTDHKSNKSWGFRAGREATLATQFN